MGVGVWVGVGLSRSENWVRNQREEKIVPVLERGKGWGSSQGLSASVSQKNHSLRHNIYAAGYFYISTMHVCMCMCMPCLILLCKHYFFVALGDKCWLTVRRLEFLSGHWYIFLKSWACFLCILSTSFLTFKNEAIILDQPLGPSQVCAFSEFLIPPSFINFWAWSSEP